MFVTLEGLEGSGKSTLLAGLAARLEAAGHCVLRTREPGGSALGREVRALLLRADSDVTPEAELFLFLADRAQHVTRVIRPALARGEVVLCDRYVDSTLVYQGAGRGLDSDALRRLCDLATGGLRPDATLMLDLDVRIGLARAASRHAAENTLASEGRFEEESTAFHQRVRRGFLRLAEQDSERISLVDASLAPEAVLEAAWSVLAGKGLTGRGSAA
ncbi:MAG: dTMP kinase [Deltaproteobacteria bacterium]|nr:dTMP kinase [Deltaproteobacteria bacterium]